MHLNLAIFVFIYWGLVPVFYKQLGEISSLDVMMHRIIWSTVLLGIYLLFCGRLKTALVELASLRRAAILTLTGSLIAADWGLYIYMIDAGKILETSLGYFIAPIVGIFFARVFLREKLGKLGLLALFLAIAACSYEAFSLGRLPVLSIVLALLVNFYTLVRKKIYISARYGFFCETLLMCPVALIYFALRPEPLNPPSLNSANDWLLVASGAVTLAPMIVYNFVTPKLDLALLSILQYITPVISFLVAIFLYDEPLVFEKFISFSLIFGAVALSIFERKNKQTER